MFQETPQIKNNRAKLSEQRKKKLERMKKYLYEKKVENVINN